MYAAFERMAPLEKEQPLKNKQPKENNILRPLRRGPWRK
jgi:hypothetical protein